MLMRIWILVHILPGVPSLFERLLTALVAKFIILPPASEKPYRMLIHTAFVFLLFSSYPSLDSLLTFFDLNSLPESHIAPFLTKLQLRVHKEGISVGSYPKFNIGVDVSLIGKDENRLKEISDEVIAELMGELVLDGKLGEEKVLGGAKI